MTQYANSKFNRTIIDITEKVSELVTQVAGEKLNRLKLETKKLAASTNDPKVHELCDKVEKLQIRCREWASKT